MSDSILDPLRELVGFEDFAALAQGLPEKYWMRASREGRFPPFAQIGYAPPRWRKDQVQAWFSALLAPLNNYAGGAV